MHNYWPRCFFCLSLLFNARINFSTGFIEGSYGGIVSILIFESETNFDTSCVLWMLALSSMMINFFISWGGSFFLSFSTLLRKWINFCDVPVPSVPMIPLNISALNATKKLILNRSDIEVMYPDFPFLLQP